MKTYSLNNVFFGMLSLVSLSLILVGIYQQSLPAISQQKHWVADEYTMTDQVIGTMVNEYLTVGEQPVDPQYPLDSCPMVFKTQGVGVTYGPGKAKLFPRGYEEPPVPFVLPEDLQENIMHSRCNAFRYLDEDGDGYCSFSDKGSYIEGKNNYVCGDLYLTRDIQIGTRTYYQGDRYPYSVVLFGDCDDSNPDFKANRSMYRDKNKVEWNCVNGEWTCKGGNCTPLPDGTHGLQPEQEDEYEELEDSAQGLPPASSRYGTPVQITTPVQVTLPAQGTPSQGGSTVVAPSPSTVPGATSTIISPQTLPTTVSPRGGVSGNGVPSTAVGTNNPSTTVPVASPTPGKLTSDDIKNMPGYAEKMQALYADYMQRMVQGGGTPVSFEVFEQRYLAMLIMQQANTAVTPVQQPNGGVMNNITSPISSRTTVPQPSVQDTSSPQPTYKFNGSASQVVEPQQNNGGGRTLRF